MAVETPICDFGWKAPEFSLKNIDEKIYSLDELRGEKGTLVMFICNHCPYVKSIISRIVRDANELADLGIATIAICSNDGVQYPDDDFEHMIAFAKANRFPFAYLHDESQDIAKAYNAVCTPDFFGFDSASGLQYRGRLDESRKDAAPNARRDLFEAMKEVALTGHGPKDQIPSMGCSIKWKAPAL